MGMCNCKEKKEEEQIEIEPVKKVEEEIQESYTAQEYFNDLPPEHNNQEININESQIENSQTNENSSCYLYNQRAFQLINQIRTNPKKYANTIIDNLKYIKLENEKFVFKKKVKVLLTRGEDAFREAATILNNTQPMKELIKSEELKIPLPNSILEINNNSSFKQSVISIQQNNNINLYFRDHIKNPEIGVLLMIVDDTGKNFGKKRNAILNPNFKKIGIDSKFVEGDFIAHYAFST